MLRVLDGDLVAKGPSEPALQRTDLLLGFAGLVLCGFHLDPQRCGAQRRLATESGDEPRLDLRLGVADLGGEVVAHERAVNASAARDDCSP